MTEMGSQTSTGLEFFLKNISADPKKHSLWLNTLSLLEHLGSRKILLTQSNEDTTEMILRHATEEARHALFFKKAARVTAENFHIGYHKNELLQGGSAKIYFAKLDATVRQNLQKDNLVGATLAYLAYLYTTTVIEKRAMIVYGLYNQILEAENHSFNLRNLILEEEGHLDEMSSELRRLDSDFERRLPLLEDKEEKLFSKFLNNLLLIAA